MCVLLRIKQHIHNTHHIATSRDLANYKRSLKGSGHDYIDQLQDVIGASEHFRVCADTHHYLIAPVIMTAEMQHLAQRFGDVLVIDATYKTNVHHMPLNSAMIINAEGHGQVICHARRLQLCSHGWPS